MNSKNNSYLPKLTKRPNWHGRTDGWTDPNYRKTSFLKIDMFLLIKDKCINFQKGNVLTSILKEKFFGNFEKIRLYFLGFQ